jgi:Putative beta barrel porin-7 (BBP7)
LSRSTITILTLSLITAGSGVRALASDPDSKSWFGVELLSDWSTDGGVRGVQVMQNTNYHVALPNQLGASYLFDNKAQDYGLQLGTRISYGRWLNASNTWGMEFSGLYYPEKEAKWNWSNAGGSGLNSTVIFYPAANNPTGWWVLSLAANNTGFGNIDITSHSKLWGVEALAVRNLRRDDSASCDMVFGLKYLNLTEDFQISFANVYTQAPVLGEYAANDRWKTQNSIIAAKLGARFAVGSENHTRFVGEVAAALGQNSESINVNGFSVWTGGPGGAVIGTNLGGAFSGPSNIGTDKQSEFVPILELKLGLEHKLTKHLALTANAHAMYITSVVRPGEQVSNAFSQANVGFGNQIPNWYGTTPARQFVTSDYFSYGLSLGMKVMF